MANIPFISTPSATDLVVSLGANFKEKGWEKTVVLHAGVGHPKSAMRQGTKDLNRRLPSAGIVTTTTKNGDIWGTERVFKIRGPIGGFGVQGSGIRLNKGATVKEDTWVLSTGVHWHGIHWDNVAKEQTIQGIGNLDTEAQNMLKGFYGWLQGNHLDAEVIRACNCGSSGTTPSTSIQQRCIMFASNKTSVNDLRSADTLKFSDLTAIEDRLMENGAEGFSLTTDGSYNDIQEFLITAPHTALAALTGSDEYTNVVSLAHDRGVTNPLFKGGMVPWRGSKVFSWKIQTSQADGPTGAFYAPQAFLGEAISAGTTSFTLKGGGNSLRNKAATNAPYFINFENARWRAWETTKIAQDTSTRRYLLAYNASTNKFAFGSYTTVTNGDIDDATGTVAPANTITVDQFLSATNTDAAKTTLGGITWNTGVWQDKVCEWSDLPVGSKIWQCNSYGQCYQWVEGMGRHALLDGYGRLRGNGTSGMGARTEEVQNHGVFAEIGMDMSYGCNAIPNMDGLPAAVLMAVAWNPPGAPVIE